jgi:Na+/proline symporter
MAMLVLPSGLIGLTIAAMLAATMSTYSSVFNAQAAVITNDVYKPFYEAIKKKEPSEKSLLWVGRGATGFIGIFGIVMAIIYASIPDMGIFRVALKMNSYILLPLMMPIALGLVIRKSAWWSALVGSILAILFAIVVDYGYTIPNLLGADLDPLVLHNLFYNTFFNRPVNDEVIDTTALKNFFQMFIILGTFLLAIPLATKEDLERPKRKKFEENLRTPLDRDEEGESKSGYWIFRPLGWITMSIGVFLLLIVPFQIFMGRRAITSYQTKVSVVSALAFLVIGGLMWWASKNHPFPGEKVSEDEASASAEEEL